MLTCPEPQANTSSLPFSKFCTQVDLSVEGEAITESADGVSEQQKCNMSALWASSHPRYYAQLEKGVIMIHAIVPQGCHSLLKLISLQFDIKTNILYKRCPHHLLVLCVILSRRCAIYTTQVVALLQGHDK